MIRINPDFKIAWALYYFDEKMLQLFENKLFLPRTALQSVPKPV